MYLCSPLDIKYIIATIQTSPRPAVEGVVDLFYITVRD
jgi:hypothetical protein